MNVIIIGGTSGIGRAVAEIYIGKGYKVGITGRRESLLEEIRSMNPGKEIYTGCFDVTSEDAAVQLESLIKEMGGVDLCLHSAGFGHTNTALDSSLEVSQVEVNASGFVRCAVHLFNYWAKSGKHGHLAVISSIASILPLGVCPAYSATKQFEAFYTEALRQLAVIRKADICFTIIKPGFVDTDFIHGRHFPMTISCGKAAKSIIKAIDKEKKSVVIDRNWALLACLMRIIPASLWRFGGRYFRKYQDLF